MWPVFTVMAYFILALLLPVGWGLARTWRRARVPRHLTCPDAGIPALVRLDPGYAVRMHVLGESEPLVRECTRWSQTQECKQACLVQVGRTV
jgi:hypothetical protein